MSLTRTTATTERETAAKVRERLASEISRSPVDLEIPSEGAIAGSIRNGDIFLHDSADEGREKGAFAWISADNWDKPTELYAVHIWGPSERHLQILIDVCQHGVDAGIGDIPISYQRSSHPLTVLADQFASVTISRDGKFSTTTLRTALATLTAAARKRRAVR